DGPILRKSLVSNQTYMQAGGLDFAAKVCCYGLHNFVMGGISPGEGLPVGEKRRAAAAFEIPDRLPKRLRRQGSASGPLPFANDIDAMPDTLGHDAAGD